MKAEHGGHLTPEGEVERFWRSFKWSASGCWEWAEGLDGGGYGTFAIGGSVVIIGERPAITSAHRYSFQMFIGPIPNGLDVLHRCDNRPCVKPTHLWLGTNLDNMRDMVAKGRARSLRGEENKKAILTRGDVLAIRARHPQESYSVLARHFGISKPSVADIICRRTWAWLDQEPLGPSL